jgi:hypothetical protein
MRKLDLGSGAFTKEGCVDVDLFVGPTARQPSRSTVVVPVYKNEPTLGASTIVRSFSMAAVLDPIVSLRRVLAGTLVLLAACALDQPARASVGVASDAGSPRLKVDAKGNAEISYTSEGERKTVLVPIKGAVLPGGRIATADVSKAAKKPALPNMKVLRRGPGGWIYALQTWPARGGPVELRFSRWKGAPTKLTFTARNVRRGISLQGRVTVAGKPIPIRSRVPGGMFQREYVYLDQRIAGQWKILGGVAVKRNGSYQRVVYLAGPTGSRFRASVAGPNVGTTYAPDQVVEIPPP